MTLILIVSILLVLAALQILIGISILLQSYKSKQIHQKMFVVVLAASIIWTLTSTLLIYVDSDARLANINYYNNVNVLSFFTAMLMLTLVYLFSLTYPVRQRLGLYDKLMLATGIAVMLLSPMTALSGQFVVRRDVLEYHYGSFSFLLIAYVFVILVSLFVRAFSVFHSTLSKTIKTQAATVLLGFAATVVHGIVFLLILPIAFGNYPLLYEIGYLAPCYFVGFTAYSLLKQGLFDIRAVLIRSVSYVVSILFIAVAAGGMVALISINFLNQEVDMRQASILALLIAAATLLFQSIVQLFNKATRRLFYRDAYSSQVFIGALNKTVVSTLRLDEMIHRSALLIRTTLRIDSCSFCLFVGGDVLKPGEYTRAYDPHEMKVVASYLRRSNDNFILRSALGDKDSKLRVILDDSSVELVIPLFDAKHNKMMGIIMMGEKKNGSAFNVQDISALSIISNELVIAIQNALRFEEIEHFNETLQKKIDEATYKLRESNKKLKQLNDSKDDFISMTSHQLRTPLTSIKGYISLVMDEDGGKINDTQRKLLAQAFNSSQKMVYLIADLLNVSRLKTGKFTIERKPTNLVTLIKDEMAQVEEEATSRGLEIVHNFPKEFPTLPLDNTKTRQVIMNFLDNAIYYTPSGGTIKVDLEELPNSVEFRVTDSGIGVPKEERHHLFTKFYRAKNALRTRPDGTGLGLYMARKVITAQGGAIIFDSTEGKGSTFGFTFPKNLSADSVVSLPAGSQD